MKASRKTLKEPVAPPGPATPGAWPHRHFFEAFHSTLPEIRRHVDAKSLTSLFTIAAQAPIAADALEWALENDVRFFIDRTCTVGGYYQEGTGAVAIAESTLFSIPAAAGIIVHEITHAKQDRDGLLAREGMNFLDRFMSTAFIEAQATAFQVTAQYQLEDFIHGRDPGGAWDMCDPFCDWYATDPSSRRLPLWYGGRLAREVGHELGLPRISPPDSNTEFRLPENLPGASPRAGETLAERFNRLNADFRGRPWFEAGGTRFRDRTALNPSLALRFYDRQRPEPPQLVRRICKAQGIDWKGPRP